MAPNKNLFIKVYAMIKFITYKIKVELCGKISNAPIPAPRY